MRITLVRREIGGSVTARTADEDSGLEGLHSRQQVRHKFMVVGVRQLVDGPFRLAFDHQTGGIHKPAALTGGGRQPLFHHSSRNQVSNADTRLAGTQEKQPLLV
jgi:hypothetical protein